jgi:predicted DNA-binding antitoxin AbrB/MazE fold protein
MGIVIGTAYGKGVLRPLTKVHLAEHDRVRLVVEPARDVVQERRRNRVPVDPEVGRAIADDPELARRR